MGCFFCCYKKMCYNIHPMQKTSTSNKEKFILWFSEISIKDVPLVGGKNASLGEMFSNLTQKGVRVPNGYAVTASAYREFLSANNIEKKLKESLKGLDTTDVKALAVVGKKIRTLILKGSFPKELEKEIIAAYKELAKKTKSKQLAVAVRSSATAEDLPNASFAGQQETYLNVKGEKDLLDAVRKCIASLFTNRAISYREANGFDHMQVALSVTVQQMVNSDTGSSGVMFTLDTESGFDGVVLINAAYGLGEYVVKGRVTPDQFYVFKKGLAEGKRSIISRILGTKEVKLVYGKTKGTKQARVLQKDRNTFSITDNDVLQLAKWGVEIEEYYGRPQDIEWAKDGKTGELYIVQARPETVQARSKHTSIEHYKLKKEGTLITTGIAVGQKIGAGKVRVINDPKEMKAFKKGEILVTRITDPDWEPIMRIASAIITEQGGKTSHAAIVSREIGVPAIVGVSGARKKLTQGKEVTADCSNGDEGRIFKGKLPFEVETIEVKEVAKTKTKIMMNIGDPEHAFELSFLPNDGIGLARLEFIFNTFIKIHPLALVHYKKLKDKKAKEVIKEMTRGYKDKREYCIDRLADGIARLAAAYHPNDVIVRLSDFKTNEYATMIGGKEFEPNEENPMIGWRGASRYYSKEYKEAFRLECEAIKRVRDEWGLDNVVVMVPFCRTPEEGEKVLQTMKEFGLERGKNGLRVVVMCEIPSNVILAEEFAKIFDGFSIGSNDLTQLTLGVDRDSAVVSDLYDAANPAVKKLISDVIKVAKKHKKYIGICGQAPSDSPEFAEFLVREGIDSISLNPDTVIETRQRIANVEKKKKGFSAPANKKILSFLVGFGLLGAALISVGAGCGGVVPPVEDVNGPDISPIELRERAQERAREELASQTTSLTISDFVTATLQYPVLWSVEQWDRGVTLTSPDGESYVSLFEQRIGRPVPEDIQQPVTVGGQVAVQYQDQRPSDGVEITVIEIEQEDNVIEINGRGDAFGQIINSISFGPTPPEQEPEFCIQVITYARENSQSECTAFPTPCDVPDGWEQCEPTNE